MFFPFSDVCCRYLFGCCVVGWGYLQCYDSTVLLLITNCLDNESTVQYSIAQYSAFITYHVNYVDERHDELQLYIYIYSGTVLVGLAEGSRANYLNVCCV